MYNITTATITTTLHLYRISIYKFKRIKIIYMYKTITCILYMRINICTMIYVCLINYASGYTISPYSYTISIYRHCTSVLFELCSYRLSVVADRVK